MNNTLVPPAAKASTVEVPGADISNDDDPQSLGPALQSDAAAEKGLEEDGPLFRATIKQLEGKTAALKSTVKRILKASIASMEAQRASLEADEAFLKALRDTPALDSLANSYLDSVSPYIQSQRCHLQNSMQALLIDPLRKIYETDVKAAETKRRQFDEESKDYYAHLAKYLSLKSEKQKGRRHSEYESRHCSKRKTFGLARFDYHAFMQDLHGGRKENEVFQHLTNYYEKEYSFYQNVASKLSDNRAELEKLHTAIHVSSKEDSQLIKERKERRSLLEQKLSLPEIQLERIASESAVSSDLRRSMDDYDTSLQPAESQTVGAINLEHDKFKGIRDMEQLDRSVPIATGRRKEGFLFSTSRPSKTSAFDVAAANWHKYWCVLSGGQLHEYSNWKRQLEAHNEPINLRFATVREARNCERRFCFEIITPQYRRTYQATSQEDMTSWITTISNAIESLLNGMNSSVNLMELQEEPLQAEPASQSSRQKYPGRSLSGAFKNGFSTGAREKYMKKINAASQSTADVFDAIGGMLSPTERNRRSFHSAFGFGNSNGGNGNNNNINGSGSMVFGTAKSLVDQAEGPDSSRLLLFFRENPANLYCADCGENNPEWCSINLGVLLCIECSGIHRSLGTHVSKVRSLTLDRTTYTPDILELLRAISNERANRVWEATLMDANKLPKPSSGDSRETKQKFITAKYVDKAFIDKNIQTRSDATDMLFTAVDDDNIELAIQAIVLGANINAKRRGGPTSWSQRTSLSSSTSDFFDSKADYGRNHPISLEQGLMAANIAPPEDRTVPLAIPVAKQPSSSVTFSLGDLDPYENMNPSIPQYILHLALQHPHFIKGSLDPGILQSTQRDFSFPMAELLLQNGADATLLDTDTGHTLSELISYGDSVSDDAITYLSGKNQARGESSLLRTAAPASLSGTGSNISNSQSEPFSSRTSVNVQSAAVTPDSQASLPVSPATKSRTSTPT
ncbi:hypothetical protein NQZ79_g2680 [Umbelopsis isabellina]|nr:hypothetical protein NQZ79_g2680 [Umbelopsis isabellina]